MEVNNVVVVEESECSDFKLLEISGGVVAVIHSSIFRASVGWNVIRYVEDKYAVLQALAVVC